MLFDRLYNKDQSDITGAPPEKGIKRFWFLTVNHFSRLVVLNLLFLLCCLPVVTIPAALAGMSRILMNLVREGTAFEWQDFFKEFKTDYLRRLLIWLPMGVITGLLLLFPGIPGGAPLLLGLGILVFIALLYVQSYWFPMMVLLDTSASACLKNAVILTLVEWKCNIKLLLPIGLMLALIMLLPYTIMILLTGTVFIQLLACIFTNEVIQRRIILPYLAGK